MVLFIIQYFIQAQCTIRKYTSTIINNNCTTNEMYILRIGLCPENCWQDCSLGRGCNQECCTKQKEMKEKSWRPENLEIERGVHVVNGVNLDCFRISKIKSNKLFWYNRCNASGSSSQVKNWTEDAKAVV